jgi:hypothetical protein
MKYALCFRGINYFENYPHNETAPPFNVDFLDSIGQFQKNIINPLREKGHQVDIFFITYDSPKLISYYNILYPKKILLNEYKRLMPGAWSNVNKIIMDSFDLVIQNQNEENIQYDYIILTRFDNYIYENILNIYIPEGAVSSISKGDADFIIIHKDVFNEAYYFFNELKNIGAVTHYYMEYFISKGIPCHCFYDKIINQLQYPFCKTSRQLTTPKDHPYYLCSPEELYDPNSRFYGFNIKPKTQLFMY